MKRHVSYTAKPRLFAHDIVFGIAAALIFLTLLSVWLVSGLYARYIVSDPVSDKARVADGLPVLEVLEHRAELKNGEYKLDQQVEVTGNTYTKVIPGVDIEKDPFVRLTSSSDVDFELYIEVTENNFPTIKDSDNNEIRTVSYGIDTSLWEEVSGKKNIYKYTGDTAAATNGEKLYILSDNKLYVSEHYVGGGEEFSLSFEAWIKQID